MRYEIIEKRAVSKRRFFLKRCPWCNSWWHFDKSWNTGWHPLSGKRLWKSYPRYDCHVCGESTQVSSW